MHNSNLYVSEAQGLHSGSEKTLVKKHLGHSMPEVQPWAPQMQAMLHQAVTLLSTSHVQQ